jgi:hypothetical protein
VTGAFRFSYGSEKSELPANASITRASSSFAVKRECRGRARCYPVAGADGGGFVVAHTQGLELRPISVSALEILRFPDASGNHMLARLHKTRVDLIKRRIRLIGTPMDTCFGTVTASLPRSSMRLFVNERMLLSKPCIICIWGKKPGLGPSCYPASLLWFPGPRPLPVFRSAICDCC